MPITCAIQIEYLTKEAFKELDYQVMKHAFHCHNTLGSLADEQVYQAAMAVCLAKAGFEVNREVEIVLHYSSFSKSLFLDFVVNRGAVYELKRATMIAPAHHTQLLTYLYLLNMERGKLVNFAMTHVETEFVNMVIPANVRREFTVCQRDYVGPADFQALVTGLVRDWGTCLGASLYKEALVALLGGKEAVEVLLPMTQDGSPIGNQRFRLLSPTEGFALTTIPTNETGFPHQLQRLLNHSPLERIQWVNIARHEIRFKTFRHG